MRAVVAPALALIVAVGIGVACSRPERSASPPPPPPVPSGPIPGATTDYLPNADRPANDMPGTNAPPHDGGITGDDNPDATGARQRMGPGSPPDMLLPPR